jgi:hypothetical protein
MTCAATELDESSGAIPVIFKTLLIFLAPPLYQRTELAPDVGQVRPQHDFCDHFDDLCWNHSFLRGDNSADPASLGAKALCGQEP